MKSKTTPILRIQGDIDYAILREQKKALLDIIFNKKKPTPKQIYLLDGLLTFIDHVQDSAENQYGSKKVFGE